MEMDSREKVVEKLSGIIKSGHTPCRKLMQYDREFGIKFANCFMHACYNLTNEQLSRNFSIQDAKGFTGFWSNDKSQILNNFISFMQETGLKITECHPSQILKQNQWEIAYYLTTDFDSADLLSGDYHFALKEENDFWTAKRGFHGTVDYFDYLPKKIHRISGDYILQGTFVITNPYAPEN